MKRIFLVLGLLFLFSCNPGKIYEKHVKMDNLAWNRFDKLTFEVPIQDIKASYDIYIAVRHITDMPYKDIDVYFDFTTPDGESRSRGLSIPIKDADGKNLGDGLGELWDVQELVWEGFKFNKPGNCTFEISSAMQQLNLIGVMEIGLIVKKQ